MVLVRQASRLSYQTRQAGRLSYRNSRSGQTMTGCLRPGVKTWLVGEAVLQELLDCPARRVRDPATGFSLLEPG